MSENGITRVLQRIADDFRATRRYLAAAASARRLTTERGNLQAELQATWLELGTRAAGAGLGGTLPGFTNVSENGRKLSQAQADLAQRQAAARQAHSSLEEQTRKHAAIVAEFSAQAKHCADIAAAATADLNSAAAPVKAMEDRIAQLQAGISRLGSAGASDEPRAQLQQQLEEQQRSLPAARQKLAAAKSSHEQAASAMAARRAEVVSAQTAADQARTQGDAAVAAANVAVAQATEVADSAQASLNESFARFGQAIFEANLTGDAIDSPTTKAKALQKSIAETESQIAAARARADAARGGTRRFAWTAGAAAIGLAALVIGATMLVSAFMGKPRGTTSSGALTAGNTVPSTTTQAFVQPVAQAPVHFAATRPAPKVFQLTPLASVEVKPSDAPQTFAWQDKVKVTLPPGLLREPAQLTLSQVKDPLEPGFTCFSALASYDVSIGRQRQFDKEIEIELAIDPALIRKDIPPEVQFTAAYFDAEEHQWVEVGCQVDPVRGKAVIRTRHLCFMQLWYLGIHYTIIGCGPGNDMGLAWNPAEIARETRNYQRVFPNNTPGLPDYVSDIREDAIAALKKYRAAGFDLYTKPLWIFVTGQGSSGHSSLFHLNG